MTIAAIFSTQLPAVKLRQIISKLEGLPKIGTHIGGGIHVTMPDTWDGTGACPPGWTQFQDNVLVHDDGIHFASVISAKVAGDAAVQALRARLLAAERTALDSGSSAAVALDSTWDTAVPL